MNLQNVPRFVIVVGAFALGLFLFTQFQKPHTKCDSQIESLQESESGWLYPKKLKKGSMQPSYFKAIENCKMGMATLGACYEYFRVVKHLLVDLQNVSSDCGEDLFAVNEVKGVLFEAVSMMVRMSWGEYPPEKGSPVAGKLESPDLALFCSLKDTIQRYLGREAWDNLRQGILPKLPGEARKYETTPEGKSICLNCEGLKPAVTTLGGIEEVYVRSLFALRCDGFR